MRAETSHIGPTITDVRPNQSNTPMFWPTNALLLLLKHGEQAKVSSEACLTRLGQFLLTRPLSLPRPEWHEIDLLKTIRQVVSRLSAKIFLGNEAVQNFEWREIFIDYTVNLCLAQRELRHFRGWSRHLAHWFLPRCIKLRQQWNRAGQILKPILEHRLEAIRLADQGLGKVPNDATGWMHQVAKGETYDPVGVQLGLSVVALHTTSDLIGHIMADLCKNPEYVGRMRDEIRQVIGEFGWEKTSLYKLKLVDSVMKESQRVFPASMGVSLPPF